MAAALAPESAGPTLQKPAAKFSPWTVGDEDAGVDDEAHSTARSRVAASGNTTKLQSDGARAS